MNIINIKKAFSDWNFMIPVLGLIGLFYTIVLAILIGIYSLGGYANNLIEYYSANVSKNSTQYQEVHSKNGDTPPLPTNSSTTNRTINNSQSDNDNIYVETVLNDIEKQVEVTSDFENTAKSKIEREQGADREAIVGILSVEKMALAVYQNQKSKLIQLSNDYSKNFTQSQQRDYTRILSELNSFMNLVTDKIQSCESALSFNEQ